MNNALNLILTAVEKKIVDLHGKSCFAAFDFDNSCIVNDIADAVFAYLCRNKLLKDGALLGKVEYKNEEYHRLVFRRYYEILEQGDLKKAYVFCAKALSGFNRKEIKTITNKTIKIEGNAIRRVRLYGISIARGLAEKPQTKKLMDALKNRNIAIWIITSSPQIVVETAIRHYGLSGKVIGLRNGIKRVIFTAEIEKPYSILEGKVVCIKNFIDSNNRPLLAAGDSMNDLPMLQYAMIPVVVDRNNALSQKAKSQGWFTI